MTSTLLSLIFIPVMYAIIDQVSNFFGKMISPAFHARGKDDDDMATPEPDPDPQPAGDWRF